MKLRPSFRSILVAAFFVVSLTPVALMTAWLYQGARANVWREARDKNQLLSQNIAGPIYLYLNAARNNLALLGRLIVEGGGPRELPAGVLRSDYFRQVLLIDGRRVSRITGEAKGTVPSLRMLRANTQVRALLRSSAAGDTGVVPDPVTGRPTVYFSRPTAAGVLLGALDLRPLEAIRERIHFGRHGHCAITDRYGTLVAHPNPQWVAHMKNVSSWPIVHSGMEGHTGVMTFYSPFTRERMIAGYASVPHYGWVVLTPQPLWELTARAERMARRGLIVGGVGLVISLLIAAWLSRRLSGGIDRLVQGLRRLQNKDYSAGFPEFGAVAPREMEVLRGYANDMAASVREAIASRDELNAELEARVQAATRELIEANSELQEKAYVDDLTRVRNRRALWKKVSEMSAGDDGRGGAVQLVLFDIDRFKEINDTWGHDAGDRVLTHVSDIIRAETRAEDFVARYGGDEFLILMEDCSGEDARARAESIRGAIEDSVVELPDGPIRVTVSVGIACGTGTGAGPAFAELLRRADQAMYESKRAGRNRIRQAVAGEFEGDRTRL